MLVSLPEKNSGPPQLIGTEWALNGRRGEGKADDWR